MYPQEPRDSGSQSDKLLNVLIISIVVGLLSTLFYSCQCENFTQFISVTGVAVALAVAALLSGALLGFLFGIPKTLQQDPNLSSTRKDEESAQISGKGVSYQVNTNLEQISDWLTKILVGVGLTKLATLSETLQNYAHYAGAGLGGFPNSKVFSVALLVHFSICGFLVSYLWTRLHLTGAFREADLVALGGKLAMVENKVGELERQVEIDAKALGVAYRQLNQTTDTSPVPQEELDAAIKDASPNARAQIFRQAQSVRSENWHDRQTKPKMERTIPIFKSLIASDVDDVYHANHGQLGFALRDKRDPEWRQAEIELSKAIEMRGPWRQHNDLLYEFNRAVCRIKLNETELGEKSPEEIKRNILSDLEAAATLPLLRKLIAEDSVTKTWLEVNGIAISTLGTAK